MAYLRGEEPLPEECLFCLNAKLEDAQACILYRGGLCYVMLNRFPYNNGHLMVVPYAHEGSPARLDRETLSELMTLTQISLKVLREAYHPDGYNLGMNIGEAAGAGIVDHLHLHIVPRWSGDTNYMTTIAKTRTIPEWMRQTYERLRPLFDELGEDRRR
jgi:ATP adenylyltransferase